MASIKKSKTATRKTKAARQATFRTATLAAGRARWEVLVSGSEKTALKKLLADIRKATTGSVPAPATGSTLPPAKPATTGSVPAATTGSVPVATTGSTLLPAKPATSGSVDWVAEIKAKLDAENASGRMQMATTGSAPAPATGSAQKATTGSL